MRIRSTVLMLSCAGALAGCAAGNDSEDLDFRGTDHLETGGGSTGKQETGEQETGDVEEGCTRTIGYWKNHNAEATRPSQAIAWPISEDTTLCGRTWLQWLSVRTHGNAWVILVRQWIGAQLNVAAGASAPADVADAIAEAGTLLDACSIDAEQRDDAIALAELLDAYNNGEAGVEHCD
jgi:hypothetical protein